MISLSKSQTCVLSLLPVHCENMWAEVNKATSYKTQVMMLKLLYISDYKKLLF